MEKNLNRDELLHSFSSLQNSFDLSLQQARELEAEFESNRQQFIEGISEQLRAARAGLPENNPVRAQVLAFIDIMEATKAEWNAKVAGREKGVAFRSRFEDSLLVFVNGKVKSGKSSLGNYMAWGDTDPTDDIKSRVPAAAAPQFFSHAKSGVAGGDADNEAALCRQFRVGAIEATSSIQGFSLPGLTWVDSPGMHSLNVQNENLARDYVEHADLILYTIKSDSAGRESDLLEITQLLSRGKKILLLITGSDDMEEDAFDDGPMVQVLVMKDQERRARQRGYVQEALEKMCAATAGAPELVDIRIVSFSARYAQLHADDAAAYGDSGMGEVCSTLRDICESEGVCLKQRTPLNNLHEFLKSCSADLVPYDKLVREFKIPLDELKTRSYKNLSIYVQQGQNDLNRFIDDFFEKRAGLRENAGEATRQLVEFQTALNARYQEIASDQLGKIFEELMTGFKLAVQETYSNSELVRLPDFELETVTEKFPIIRPGTRKRNSVLGAIGGGIAGFFLGGPPGAMLGASIGGSAGGAVGNSAATDYRDVAVTVGDNLLDIRRNAIENSNRALQSQMQDSAAHLWQLIDKDVDNILIGLQGEIGRFGRKLQDLLQKTHAI